jgi:hypothetical protein
VPDRSGLAALAASESDLSPEDCALLARAAAAHVDLDELSREGAGSAELLWRDAHSEGWLNTWWQRRDTGFHDHDGSCVGVYVLDGRARAESLVMRGEPRVREVRSGESYSLPGSGIHRVDHLSGAVTIHVYSPPLRAIGHYDVVDGELHRSPRPADEVSEPSPALDDTLAAGPRGS